MIPCLDLYLCLAFFIFFYSFMYHDLSARNAVPLPTIHDVLFLFFCCFLLFVLRGGCRGEYGPLLFYTCIYRYRSTCLVSVV